MTASTPSRSSFQKDSGSSAPPGKRQPMPTRAIGSECRRSHSSSRARNSRSSTMARLTGESGLAILESCVVHHLLPLPGQFFQQQGLGLGGRQPSSSGQRFRGRPPAVAVRISGRRAAGSSREYSRARKSTRLATVG